MNYAIKYYQTLEEIPSLLRPEKPKKDKELQALFKKIAKTWDIKKLKINPWPTKIFQ